MHRVGLQGLEQRPSRALSGGQQQRLALARALATKPQLLFLDEPTASLDPAATTALEDIICNVAARCIKVVMSTHDLGEARRLAGLIADRLRERSASAVAPSALARLEIKLDIPPGLPLEEVANRIVNRLAGQLGLEEA